MPVDLFLKAKKLEVVGNFINSVNVNKALGNEKLTKFLRDNNETFVRGIITAINSELKPDKDDVLKGILNNEKKKLLSGYMKIRDFLEAQTTQEMDEKYSKIIEDLNALKALIESEQ